MLDAHFLMHCFINVDEMGFKRSTRYRTACLMINQKRPETEATREIPWNPVVARDRRGDGPRSGHETFITYNYLNLSMTIFGDRFSSVTARETCPAPTGSPRERLSRLNIL